MKHRNMVFGALRAIPETAEEWQELKSFVAAGLKARSDLNFEYASEPEPGVLEFTDVDSNRSWRFTAEYWPAYGWAIAETTRRAGWRGDKGKSHRFAPAHIFPRVVRATRRWRS